MTFDIEAVFAELQLHFQGSVRRNESLARHCTFGVGGPADIWVSVEKPQDLTELVRLCAERAWPLLVVGNGTNAATYRLLGGVHAFNDGILVRNNALLAGCGTLNADVTIASGGTVLADCSPLVFTGSVSILPGYIDSYWFTNAAYCGIMLAHAGH